MESERMATGMVEYIEREAISEEIRKYYYKNPPNSSYEEGFDRGLDRAQRAILDAPAADVEPVVRCRECKHCDPENYHCDHPMGTAAPLRRKPDDFCSYGERKEGADND